MAFLWDQRQRLMREYWTAPSLAEELFAMMSPDVASNTNGPVAITLPDEATVAPLTIGNYTDGAPAISFKSKSGEDLGSWAFGDDGITIKRGPTTTVIGGSGGSKTNDVGKTYPGQVMSGSGSTYTVNIYKSGLAGPATSVTVTQLQISGDNVPSGTWALVAQGPNNEFTMQVPCWVG